MADWQIELNDQIEAHRDEPFDWGVNDCFTFAVKCEQAKTGKTRFPELFRAKYANQFGSIKAFMKNGYRGMMDCVNARCQEKPIAMAERGDWVCFDTPDGEAIGVCIGVNFAAVGEDGLIFLPMSRAKKVWSI